MALSLAKIQQEYYETLSLIWINLAEEIERGSSQGASI